MKVKFYATLRQVVGGKAVDVSVKEGTTIREVLEEIMRRYPELRSKLFDQEGEMYRNVHIFINGRDIPYLEDTLETVISEDDIISVFPAVGGGCEL